MMTLKKELGIFFAVTLIVTWLLWLPSVLATMGVQVPVMFLIVSMMASFTPSIGGILLHRAFMGKYEFVLDMRQRLSFGFKKIWLLAIPAFFSVTAGLSYAIMGRVIDDFEPVNATPWFMAPLVFLQILFIGGALGEELGWRGFALPRLLRIMPDFQATLLLGLIWSLWHLPLFFMMGTVQSNIPIWQFMVQNTVISFFYTWLYDRTKGNLWLMIFLHAIANTAAAVFPYWQTNAGRFIGLGILLISCIALFIVWPLKNTRNI